MTELEKRLTARVKALEAKNRLLQQKLEALIRLHFVHRRRGRTGG